MIILTYGQLSIKSLANLRLSNLVEAEGKTASVQVSLELLHSSQSFFFFFFGCTTQLVGF